jgi:hypothetical protein
VITGNFFSFWDFFCILMAAQAERCVESAAERENAAVPRTQNEKPFPISERLANVLALPRHVG